MKSKHKEILSIVVLVLFAFLAMSTWDTGSGTEFFGGSTTGCHIATFFKENEIRTKQTGLLVYVREKDEFFVIAPISNATVRVSVKFVDYVKTEDGNCTTIDRHSTFQGSTNYLGLASFLFTPRTIDNLNEHELIFVDVRSPAHNSQRKKLFPVYFNKDYVEETFELVSKANL